MSVGLPDNLVIRVRTAVGTSYPDTIGCLPLSLRAPSTQNRTPGVGPVPTLLSGLVGLRYRRTTKSKHVWKLDSYPLVVLLYRKSFTSLRLIKIEQESNNNGSLRIGKFGTNIPYLYFCFNSNSILPFIRAKLWYTCRECGFMYIEGLIFRHFYNSNL